MGVCHPGHPVAGDFQHVLEPVGDQQPDGSALVLQHGVGGDGGAVEDVDHLGRVDAAGGEDLGEAGHETDGRVFGGGRGLEDPLRVGFQVAEDYVGEGAADIDGYGVGSHVVPLPNVITELFLVPLQSRRSRMVRLSLHEFSCEPQQTLGIVKMVAFPPVIADVESACI